MKKTVCLICCLLMLFGCEKKTSDDKDVVKIGVSFPLTGSFADTSLSAKEALMMALEKWQKKGTKYHYELYFEDDSSMPQKAALNAQNLIKIKGVRAIISLFGITDKVIDDIAEQNNVISLSCAYGKIKVPTYGFNNCVQNEDVAEILINQLKKENIKKVALVMASTNVSLTVGDYFNERLLKEGFEVVAYEKYNMDTRDMRLSILKMEEKNPDYYLTFATAPLTDIFVKQLKETIGKRNVASFGSFPEMDPSLFYLIEGLWTVYTIAGSDKFEKEFKTKTHHHLKSCAANSYDNLDMLIWAFENTESQNGKMPDNFTIINKIKHLKTWQGATGNLYIQDGVAHPKADLRMYENGKWVKIEE